MKTINKLKALIFAFVLSTTISTCELPPKEMTISEIVFKDFIEGKVDEKDDKFIYESADAKVKEYTTRTTDRIYLSKGSKLEFSYNVRAKVSFDKPVKLERLKGSFEGKNATKKDSLTFKPAKSSLKNKRCKEYYIEFKLETKKSKSPKKLKDLKETGTITIEYKPKRNGGKNAKQTTKTFEYYCLDED